jgi:hypothetical protein
VITETDDFFCHQAIQPHAYVALNDLSWADRAYHTLSDPGRFGLDIGVSTYPNRGNVPHICDRGGPGPAMVSARHA